MLFKKMSQKMRQKILFKSYTVQKMRLSYYIKSNFFFFFHSFFVVAERSILFPLFFLIYFSNLQRYTVSTVKQVSDDILLVFYVANTKATAYDLNSDLQNKPKWVYRWKMSFTPALNKQLQRIIC